MVRRYDPGSVNFRSAAAAPAPETAYVARDAGTRRVVGTTNGTGKPPLKRRRRGGSNHRNQVGVSRETRWVKSEEIVQEGQETM
jgi:hypothetical protein